LDDDFFHSELRLRHIGSRRHADEEVEEEEVFDAAATYGVRRSECRLVVMWLSHVNEESVI